MTELGYFLIEYWRRNFKHQVKIDNAAIISRCFDTYISQPHKLKLREDSLDDSDEEVHGVDVDERVVFHVAMLDLNGDRLTRRFQRRFVDLSQAGDTQRFLIKVGKHLKWLEMWTSKRLCLVFQR